MRFTFERSNDDVMIVNTPFMRLTYDGERIEIEDTQVVATGTTSGLCGDNNGDRRADLHPSLEACVAPSYKAAANVYKIQDNCGMTLNQTKTDTCQTIKVENPAVSRLYSVDLKHCSQMKYSIIRQGNKVCLSTSPLLECGSGCIARSVVRRAVSFTCVPASMARIIQQQRRAVNTRQGSSSVVPQLRNIRKTFSAEM